MNNDIGIKTSLAAKWLQVILYIGIASIVNSLVTVIPSLPDAVSTCISRAIMAAMIFCTYRLSVVNEHYGKAAKYRAVMLGCTLATAYLFSSTVLTFVASIFSLMSVYQEYSGHAELIKETNPKLSGKWHSLFYWGFVAGILVSMGTLSATVLIAAAGQDILSAVPWIVAALSVPQIIIEIIYIGYLKKTIRIVADIEENGYDL